MLVCRSLIVSVSSLHLYICTFSVVPSLTFADGSLGSILGFSLEAARPPPVAWSFDQTRKVILVCLCVCVCVDVCVYMYIYIFVVNKDCAFWKEIISSFAGSLHFLSYFVLLCGLCFIIMSFLSFFFAVGTTLKFLFFAFVIKLSFVYFL